MKVPLSWLRELVTFDVPLAELRQRLTMAGLEVEEVDVVGADWRGVTIGRISELSLHPRRESLSVARVDLGASAVTVVTGATNLHLGDIVPHVAEGGRLGFGDVGAREFGGIVSEGMVCSGDELAISPDRDGIYVLEPDAPIGTPLADYLDEVVLDMYITANRPDCMSVMGVAREVHALFGAPYTPAMLALLDPATWAVRGSPGAGAAADVLQVRIEDSVGCPRFSAAVVRGMQIGPSPRWLQRRLHFAGVRPISNVVDVTNYVMLEVGQPLHAFDRSRLGSLTIVVRRAVEGERLRTLDGEDRVLHAEMMVVADEQRPRSLAGVMGGEDSEIADSTAEVVLEGASWDRASIRRASGALNLSSEASRRFGRGVDPDLTALGVSRAVALTLALAGGTALDGLVDAYPGRSAPAVITVRPAQIEALLGVPYAPAFVRDTLRSLGFGVQERGSAVEARGSGAEALGFGAEALGSGAEALGSGAEALGSGAEAGGSGARAGGSAAEQTSFGANVSASVASASAAGSAQRAAGSAVSAVGIGPAAAGAEPLAAVTQSAAGEAELSAATVPSAARTERSGAATETPAAATEPAAGEAELPASTELSVTVPGWRRFDVEGRADLAEEVGRIAGFDQVPATMVHGAVPAPRPEGDAGFSDELRARRTLAAAGLQEVITYSLVDPAYVSLLDGESDQSLLDGESDQPLLDGESEQPLRDGESDQSLRDRESDQSASESVCAPGGAASGGTSTSARSSGETATGAPAGSSADVLRHGSSNGPLRVANPQSVEQSVLRPSLLGSLLATLRANLRQRDRALLFELARTWHGALQPLPDERRFIGIAMTGPRLARHWSLPAAAEEPLDFFDLKGVVAALCEAFRVDVKYAPTEHPHLHPGRSAALQIGHQRVGLLGQLHPEVADRFDLGGAPVLVAEIDFELLLLGREPLEMVQTPSRFPSADRDIAVVVDESISHADILAVIRDAAGSLLESVQLFDVYRGESIPAGRKSMAFALRYRAGDRTLEEDEVANAHGNVERAVRERFGAEVRGR